MLKASKNNRGRQSADDLEYDETKGLSQRTVSSDDAGSVVPWIYAGGFCASISEIQDRLTGLGLNAYASLFDL
jgi:hypothetical protein